MRSINGRGGLDKRKGLRAVVAAALLLAAPVTAEPRDAGRQRPACVISDGVHCFDARGRLAWSRLADRHALGLTETGERVFVGTSAGVVALSRRTGDSEWERRDLGWAYAPAARGDALWLGTRSGRIVRMDAATGETCWSRQRPGWVYTPSLAGGVLVTGGRAAALWGLDAGTSRELWSRRLSQEVVDSPVAVSAGRIAVATFDGRIRIIRAATGETVGGRRLGTPVVDLAGGAAGIHALTMDATLFTFAAKDGGQRWRRQVEGRPDEFTVAGDRLLVRAGGGSVIALDRRNGRLVARGHVPGRLAAPPLPDGRIVLRPDLRIQPLELVPEPSSRQHTQRGG